MLSWATSRASRSSAGIASSAAATSAGGPQVVEHHAVEPLGEPAEGGVAVGPHLGQHGADLVDGRVGLGGGWQPAAEVAAAGPTQVESAEHDRQR